MPEKEPYGARSWKLNVNASPNGELVVSLIIRSWRGAEVWDQRFVPSTPLNAPPPPPAGVPEAVWMVFYAANEVLWMHRRDDPDFGL
jgi:hypothetical protein